MEEKTNIKPWQTEKSVKTDLSPNVAGKSILLFAPFGATKHYGLAIREELQRRGADVFLFDERPSQNSITKIVIRLFKNSVPQLFDNYINKVIGDIGEKQIDYILICRGEAFTPLTIEHLREAFPKAKVILYLWDILAYCDKRNIIKCCDRAFSFDPEDVENNDGLTFRPTFYVNQYSQMVHKAASYDICFIGTVYPPRQKAIRRLTASFQEQGLCFFRYMYVPSVIVYMRNLIKGFPFFHIWQVKFNPLDISGITEILSESLSIIDINPPVQKSLSTRPYEALAARRKYITTNKEIKEYDFYNENNIFVLDINHPVIPKSFFTKPFVDIPQDIMYKYSVRGLVDDLFND